MWEPLPAGVTWKSPPLFNFDLPRATLVAHLGPPSLRGDSNGVGPVDVWCLRFPCGLEIALWIYLGCPGEPAPGDEEPNDIELYSNERDEEHIRFHLPLLVTEIHKWGPDETIPAPHAWHLLRQDDNGNRFSIASFTSRCEAQSAAETFEARGHKQTYWVDPSPGPAIPERPQLP